MPHALLATSAIRCVEAFYAIQPLHHRLPTSASATSLQQQRLAVWPRLSFKQTPYTGSQRGASQPVMHPKQPRPFA